MTDKTKLIKAQNNLIEFIDDKSKDIFMLLKTQKHIDKEINVKSADEVKKDYKKSLEESKKISKKLMNQAKGGADELNENWRAELLEQRYNQYYQDTLGEWKDHKLDFSNDSIQFILDDNYQIKEIDENIIYSAIIKGYAQNLLFPWDGGFDEKGEKYIRYHKFPKLRSDIISFITVLKKYLLIVMKERYNILTLDIIPDSQNTLLGIFSLGNKVNEKIKIDATKFFQEKLEEVFEDVFIDETSQHFYLKTKGLGNQVIENEKLLCEKWFNGQKEEAEKVTEFLKQENLKDIKVNKELFKDFSQIDKKTAKNMKKWFDEIFENKKREIEIDEYSIELTKSRYHQIKKHIDSNTLTINKITEINYNFDKKFNEHPLVEDNEHQNKFDPQIKIKPIFIERSKRMRFETVAEKRLSNIEKSISTFNNFFSKTNVANYDFTKDDMISIDERITKSVNQFRLNYEQFFASNPDKKVKKNSKIEKYKKNIDGTDPSVIQNIREKMKGGD
tara:strand:+ start:26 stop:1534 length:1509 start_codon:yes stop_codon:yes gene_type:complete